MQTHRLRLVSLLILVAAAPATQPAGVSVSGKVAVTGDAPVPEMIVYLESTDPSARFGVPADAEVSQKGARFAPSPLVVSVGQSVIFKNDEVRPIEHNVFSRSPTQQFDLGLYRPPEGKRVTFTTPGLVRLYCSIHRYMDGIIYVCPTPFWANVESNGTYAIEGVPPGQWRVRTWQKQAKYDEQDAPVRSGDAPVTVNLELSRK